MIQRGLKEAVLVSMFLFCSSLAAQSHFRNTLVPLFSLSFSLLHLLIFIASCFVAPSSTSVPNSRSVIKTEPWTLGITALRLLSPPLTQKLCGFQRLVDFHSSFHPSASLSIPTSLRMMQHKVLLHKSVAATLLLNGR